mmetsp:Transcript_7996/g.19705  ORF Transcript_7996/g.19705 Transcript_7996/m.19705 type:complete len:235 (-) Transcript_7996:278-982(-)
MVCDKYIHKCMALHVLVRLINTQYPERCTRGHVPTRINQIGRATLTYVRMDVPHESNPPSRLHECLRQSMRWMPTGWQYMYSQQPTAAGQAQQRGRDRNPKPQDHQSSEPKQRGHNNPAKEPLRFPPCPKREQSSGRAEQSRNKSDVCVEAECHPLQHPEAGVLLCVQVGVEHPAHTHGVAAVLRDVHGGGQRVTQLQTICLDRHNLYEWHLLDELLGVLSGETPLLHIPAGTL